MISSIYIIYAFIAGFSLWPVWRLFNPWRCKCGKVHWSSTRFFEHLTMKHSFDERKI